MKKMKSIQLTLLAGLAMVVLSFGSGLTGCGNDGDDTDVAVFSPRDYACAADTTTPCETTVPESEASRTREIVNEYSTPQTFTYLIDRFSFPRPEIPALGFNLDGINSGEGAPFDAGVACNLVIPDFESEIDPSHVGVDNAFSYILSIWEGAFGLLDEINFYQIQDGTQLLFIQVSGVDSLVNDPEVQIQLFYGDPGQTPELTDGNITPGQSFDASAWSEPANASILDGRLAINNFSTEIPVYLGSYTVGEDFVVPTPLRFFSPAFRFDISETALSNAAIGGTFLSSELVDWLLTAGTDTATAEEFVYQYSDIRPSEADATQCDGLSIGLGFTAISAELN